MDSELSHTASRVMIRAISRAKVKVLILEGATFVSRGLGEDRFLLFFIHKKRR
jgi:hypothetical protein